MLKTPGEVAARTLGFALIYSLNVDGRPCLAREINSTDRDAEILAGLAHLQVYIFGFIRVCKFFPSSSSSDFDVNIPLVRNPKGPTPFSSPQTKRHRN
jgi:hypothetical protein